MAISQSLIAKWGLSSKVSVCSRGLTDAYSVWGSPAEPRMVAAMGGFKGKFEWADGVIEFMEAHGSKLITREEAEEGNTVMFMVTSAHMQWTEEAVGKEVLEKARKEGRLRMIDGEGGDVADPYFGGEREYGITCRHLLCEVPKTLGAVLRERGVMGAGEWGMGVAGWENWGAKGRELGAEQMAYRDNSGE